MSVFYNLRESQSLILLCLVQSNVDDPSATGGVGATGGSGTPTGFGSRRHLFRSTSTTDVGAGAASPAAAQRSTGLVPARVYEAMVAAGATSLLRSFGALEDGGVVLHTTPPEGPLPLPFVRLRDRIAAVGSKAATVGAVSTGLTSAGAGAGGSGSAPSTPTTPVPLTTDSSMTFLTRQTATAHSKFWRDWLTVCRVNRLHALEFITQRALACVAVGRYADAAALTLPAPALRPLVVLLAWDQVCVVVFRCSLGYVHQGVSWCV